MHDSMWRATRRDPRTSTIRELALATGATMTGPTPPAEPTPSAEPSPEPPPSTPSTPAEPAPVEPPPDPTKLAEALAKERVLRKDAERRAKDGDKAKERAEELENAGKNDVEKAEAKGRREGAAEAAQKANTRLVRSEARALAGERKFRDPQLVVKLLELDDVSVTEDGDVDSDAITTQLERLGKDQPYLLVGEEKPSPGVKPDPTQGAHGAKTSGAERGKALFEQRHGGRTTSPATH